MEQLSKGKEADEKDGGQIMREIKFRAWTPVDREQMSWSYNRLDVFFIFVEASRKEGKEVHVMQFTGLKDKNGVDIYEGDVVQFADKWEWHRNTFDTFGGGFLATKADYDEVLTDHVKYPYERRVVELPLDYKWLLSSEIQIYWEVIGNVFENPELMEAE